MAIDHNLRNDVHLKSMQCFDKVNLMLESKSFQGFSGVTAGFHP